MTKNLLKQIMIKKDEPIHNDDTGYTEGLVDAIQQGYVADIKPKFTKKYSFSPSGLAWGSGECARFWYLAFDGAVFYDNADPYGVANRAFAPSITPFICSLTLFNIGAAFPNVDSK